MLSRQINGRYQRKKKGRRAVRVASLIQLLTIGKDKDKNGNDKYQVQHSGCKKTAQLGMSSEEGCSGLHGFHGVLLLQPGGWYT